MNRQQYESCDILMLTFIHNCTHLKYCRWIQFRYIHYSYCYCYCCCCCYRYGYYLLPLAVGSFSPCRMCRSLDPRTETVQMTRGATSFTSVRRCSPWRRVRCWWQPAELRCFFHRSWSCARLHSDSWRELVLVQQPLDAGWESFGSFAESCSEVSHQPTEPAATGNQRHQPNQHTSESRATEGKAASLLSTGMFRFSEDNNPNTALFTWNLHLQLIQHVLSTCFYFSFCSE